MAQPKILLVDDEPNVLAGLKRLLDGFEILTATSGRVALGILESQGPFAAVVSDMRMPEMDGAAFLAHAREVSPDTVRLLLTGFADVKSAISAVNDGGIFRFLCKPCDPDQLQRALEDAARQHELVVAERELLERTLAGALQVLTDVLALAAPEAFSRSSRLTGVVRHAVKKLRLADGWKYEAAATLSQLGCIALPDEVIRRVLGRKDATDADQQLYLSHAESGGKLLAPIPRLEAVAEMVRLQHAAASTLAEAPRDVQMGAALLRLAHDVHDLVVTGSTVPVALDKLARARRHERRLLEALADYRPAAHSYQVRSLRVDDLQMGMALDEDVRTTTGVLVVGKGQEVTLALLERLQKFARGVGVVEPLRVRVAT